jgi:hypothetical protein
MTRAVERVSLACKALSAAASDLHVARNRNPAAVDDSIADTLNAEVERICELAEDLARRAERLPTFAGVQS